MQASSPDQATVFVVDDDPDIRQAMTYLLESVGMNCQTFGPADEFLSGYSSSPSSCLVLDIRLPGMSGLELQQELVDINTNLPIILITGHGDVQMAVEAMRLGAVDFIEKPFRDQTLLDSINQAVTVSMKSKSLESERSEIAEK